MGKKRATSWLNKTLWVRKTCRVVRLVVHYEYMISNHKQRVQISIEKDKIKDLKKKATDLDLSLSEYLVNSAATVSRMKLDLSSDK